MKPQVSEAIEEVAKTLLEIEFPKVARRVKVSVQYFGHGNRFSVRRNGTDKLDMRIYFHRSSNAKLPELVREAARRAEELLEEKVSIRRELLEKLVTVSPALSDEEILELQDLLED